MLKQKSIDKDNMQTKLFEGFAYLILAGALLGYTIHLIYVACNGESKVIACYIIFTLFIIIFAWIGISEGIQSCKDTIENIRGHYIQDIQNND